MAIAGFQAARAVILKRFKTQWDIKHPEVSGVRNVPVAWPNVQFDPKVSFSEATQDGWVRLTVIVSGARQVSTSGDVVRSRTRGITEVQIFTPLGTGDESATGISDDVVSSLQFVTLDGVVIGAASPHPIGTTQDGWYQTNVSVLFRYDLLTSYTAEATYGTWQNPEILGGTSGLYIWYNATTGNEMHKGGSAPKSDTDGVIPSLGVIV